MVAAFVTAPVMQLIPNHENSEIMLDPVTVTGPVL